MGRIFTTSFCLVYPLHVAKAERKGRTQAEVDEVIQWLIGVRLNHHFDAGMRPRAPPQHSWHF